jgi:hypothetical protein
VVSLGPLRQFHPQLLGLLLPAIAAGLKLREPQFQQLQLSLGPLTFLLPLIPTPPKEPDQLLHGTPIHDFCHPCAPYHPWWIIKRDVSRKKQEQWNTNGTLHQYRKSASNAEMFNPPGLSPFSWEKAVDAVFGGWL